MYGKPPATTPEHRWAPIQLGTRRNTPRPGCSCPAQTYNPATKPTTSPACPRHGTPEETP